MAIWTAVAGDFLVRHQNATANDQLLNLDPARLVLTAGDRSRVQDRMQIDLLRDRHQDN